MRILFIGDIVGRPGRKVVRENLMSLKKENLLDFVIANGENAAGGFGVTDKVFQELREMGIDVVTSGNHIWDKKEVYKVIDQEDRLLRPLNYPSKAPGRGYGIYNVSGKGNIGVINLSGRVFMAPNDCPFRTFDDYIEKIRKVTPIIIVDFHAEATSEKKAFFYYADGRVSAVLGTHTHVPTADAQVSQKGTAFISDVGMTGVQDSVIGVEPEAIVAKFVTGLPQKFEVAAGNPEIKGILIVVSSEGKVEEFKPINLS